MKFAVIKCRLENLKKNSPERVIFLGGGHVDYSRLINDARRTIALLHDAHNPGRIAFLLFDLLTECACLISRQYDQQTAAGLRTGALNQSKQIATRFRDRMQFVDHRQIVENKRDLVLLLLGQVIGMTQQPESADVGGAMNVRLELLHQIRRDHIQSGHRIQRSQVGLVHVLVVYDQLYAIPSLRIVQPLVGEQRDLCA